MAHPFHLTASHARALRVFLTLALLIPLALNFFLNQVAPAYAGSCAEDPTNLITNGTMAPGSPNPFGVVSANWNAFVVSANVPNFENAPNEGWDPNGSQYIWSDNGYFDAGIYQRVTNLAVGQTYHYWIVWGQAQHEVQGVDSPTNQIERQIGIDLTGGTNPRAASVQWSVPLDPSRTSGFSRIEWNLYFNASGSTATFFMRVVNHIADGRNKVFFDTACLFPSAGSATTTPWATTAVTATRTATLSPTQAFTATPTSANASATPTRTNTPTFTSTLVALTSTLTRTFTATATRAATEMATLTPNAACALTPVTTINVGAHPKGIAVDPATNRVFVGLADSSSIAVIDANTRQLLATWTTDGAGNTNGLAFAQNKLFVSKRNNASVSVVDTTNGAFVQNIAVGNAPYGVGASSTRVWVANFSDSTISLIDAATNTVLSTTAASLYPSLIAPLGSRAFISAWGAGVMDVDTNNTVQKTLATGDGSFGVATNSTTNRAYVSNRNTSVLTTIDTSTDAVLGTFTETAVPYALALNPNTHHLFIVLADSNVLRVRDASTMNFVADLSLGVQGANGGDSIAVLNNSIYVANNSDGTVTVITDCASPATTPTATPTRTPTRTATSTMTPTTTRTLVSTSTPTQTPTQTPTNTPALTNTPAATVTETPFVPSIFIYLPLMGE